MEAKAKKGILLLNIGSPEKPEVKAIRRYLRMFLSDRRVITPWFIRRIILPLFILPFRPFKIVSAYRMIWDGKSFPLTRHSHKVIKSLSASLGKEYQIELGLNHGSPSIERALNNLFRAGVSKLFIFPLFPQYASATTGSTMEKVLSLIARRTIIPKIASISSFYDHPGFIECWREIGQECRALEADHVLFSFHGLPESHVKNYPVAGDHCLRSPDCCGHITALNSMCYRAQCVSSAKLIAAKLKIPPKNHSVAFQSRLGRGDWIQPYTSHRIKELAESGVKNLLVLCPSFVVDCLETIYEISTEERENFLKNGGKNLTLAPSLNNRHQWIQTLLSIIKSNVG